MLNSSYLKNLMDDMEIFMRKSLMQLPLGVLRTGKVKIMKVLNILIQMEF